MLRIKVRTGSALKPAFRVITFLIMLLAVFNQAAFAQGDADPVPNTGDFITENLEDIMIGLLIVILGVFLFGMIVLGDKLIKISMHRLEKKTGADVDALESKYRFFPRLLPPKKKDDPLGVIKIEKGFDIYIKGPAKKEIKDHHPNTVAIRPESFHGMSPIPKVVPEVGDEVKAGDPIFYDKKRPEIMYTAPVSGEVVEIRRGQKRKITDIVILADKEIKYRQFDPIDISTASRQQIVDRMLESGTWPLLRQRPFDIVADPNDSPKMIWISCFDTAPLAPDHDFMIEGRGADFQAGLDVLKRLTENDVHLGLSARQQPNDIFLHAKGVKKHFFSGPHPAGNIGIQIHHVDPINKGDVVWYLDPQDVALIGHLFIESRLDATRIIALAGPEIIEPQYYRTYIGASIEGMIKDNLRENHVRFISGNVLTGRQMTGPDGHIGFYHHLCTVILEGDKYEFFGWLMPSYPRPTFNPSFLSYYLAGEEHRVDTNSHGEERAFVQTGLYDQVLPMNILPIPLLKSILIQDFEHMEGLGIYEVSAEDFALCEFICPSKIDIQQIITDGLDTIRTQG